MLTLYCACQLLRQHFAGGSPWVSPTVLGITTQISIVTSALKCRFCKFFNNQLRVDMKTVTYIVP